MIINRRSVSNLAGGAGAVLAVLLTGCVPTVQAPQPAPVAARPLPAPTPPAAVDWHDMPATPGVWQWRREGTLSIARFGAPVLFSLTCDPLAGTIGLMRHDSPGVATTMTIVTTSSSRVLAVRTGGGATLSARDTLLDAMAYSRGRFAVQVAGIAALYLPSWPEVSRVIEDCRRMG